MRPSRRSQASDRTDSVSEHQQSKRKAQGAAETVWNAVRRLALGTAFGVIGLLGPDLPARAHLDGGPLAFQELIWIIQATVHDDMDTFGAGELWIESMVNQIPSHEHEQRTRIPTAGTVDLAAPPDAAFPGAVPKVIYNHLNCWPLERPMLIEVFLIDDDSPQDPDSSRAFAVAPLLIGPDGGGSNEITYLVFTGIIRTPQFDVLCRNPGPIPSSEQPAVPPPPEQPSSELPPTPEELELPEGEPEIPPELDEELPPINELTEFEATRPSFLKRWDGILILGFFIGFVVALLGFLLRRRIGRPSS